MPARLIAPPVPFRRPLQPGLRRWLRAGGSLTARLDAAFGPVHVQRVRQGGGPLLPEERRALAGPPRGHVREVILHGAAGPLVYARSVLDQRHAMTRWQAVRGLGGRPLADLLFARRTVSRSALVPAWYPPGHPLTRQIHKRWLGATGEMLPGRGLWTRSSVFWRSGQPLRVMEAFNPAICWRRNGPTA